jgi:hypothetical protein
MESHDVRLPPLLDAIVMRNRNRVVTLGVLSLLLVACGGPRLSIQKASGVIQGAAEFKVAKLLYVPRVLAIPAEGMIASTATREGQAMDIIQIASIDPVVAILRARDRIAIEDFVSAVPSSIVIPPKPDADTATKADTGKKNDSTKTGKDSTQRDSTKSPNDSTKKPKPKPLNLNEPHTSPPPAPPLAQAWVHTLRVTPRVTLQSPELSPDDGDDNPENPRVVYGTQPIGRNPGWTLTIATREFMRVLDVAAYTPAVNEAAGEARIDFLWKWHPTKPGALFDTESAEFESLPKEVQQAALTGSITVDATTLHWARATIAREATGWKVTGVNWNFGDGKPHDRW